MARYIKILLTVSLSCALAGLLLDFLTIPLLPGLLREYVADAMEAENSTLDWVVAVVTFCFFIYFVVAIVLIFTMHRKARFHFTLVTGLTLLLSLFSGPIVSTAYSNPFFTVSDFCWGAILFAMYFTDLKFVFENAEKPV